MPTPEDALADRISDLREYRDRLCSPRECDARAQAEVWGRLRETSDAYRAGAK